MDLLLYWPARLLLSCVRRLPVRLVARCGRLAGALAYGLDLRHRRVALENLRAVFGAEQSPEALRALARENFRRIGESFACAVKTGGMNGEELRQVLEFEGLERVCPPGLPIAERNRVIAIGHFGHFELFAPAGQLASGYQFATTYRALESLRLSRLWQSFRTQSGCLFFERRSDADALRAALAGGGVALGLLADQHAGPRGVWGPFLGRECSTTPAPAVLALRYRCPLFVAVCYRVDLGRWRIEVSDEIPTRLEGRARPVAEITADVNRVFEAAVRRDPANWFWVHNRWKPRGRSAGRSPAPPNALVPRPAVPDAASPPSAPAP